MKLKIAGYSIKCGDVATITVETVTEETPHTIQKRKIYIVHKTRDVLIIEDF